MGGLIAFEIAQQLLQCGETVELLALLDTQLDRQCLTFQDRLLHQGVRMKLELREIRARSWRQRAGYIFLRAGHFADRLRLIAGKTPKHSSVDEQKLRGVLRLSPRQRKVILVLRVAMAAYRPKTYSGKVTFLHAGVPNPRWPDPLRVWKGICQELEVVEVSADHDDLIRPPSVRYVANTLDRLLAAKEWGHLPKQASHLTP